jgi:hypothetical protein
VLQTVAQAPLPLQFAPDAFGSVVVHAFPHPPQLLLSVCSLTQAPPHNERPPLQPQAPHWQVLPQVCVPLVSQLCVALGAHAPWPEHADHADQVPPVHVRVSVPQLPQACDAAPLHPHEPFAHEEPLGHAFPQVPQLLLSVCLLTHAPPHAVYPLLQAKVHALAWHAACACDTLVAHAWPQALQLLASLVVSMQLEPQSVVWLAEQFATHWYVPPRLAQSGAAPEQTVPQAPHAEACVRLASHPSLGSPLQSP